MKLHRWLKHILPATKSDIEKILMKEAEEVAAINALTARLQKANAELQRMIKDLTDAVSNNAGDVPQDVVDAVTGLTQAVQAVDDIVPDEPAPAPVPEPPTT